MRLLLTLLAALCCLGSFAQAPARFNYQAIIRDSNGGALVANRTVTMRISILAGSATGPAVYVEQHSPTTDINGLITIDIGAGTVVSGSLSSLGWSQGNYYLKTETDPLGTGSGNNYTIVGVSQLESVPYALYANSAGHHIGELYGGGIIFYLWYDPAGVQHGLIASLKDLGTSTWATPVISNPTTAASHLDGATNTTAIIAASVSSAAGLCRAYTDGSHSDWYLPAIWELNQLYSQVIAINTLLESDNDPQTTGLNLDIYWSSTIAQSTATTQNAWAQQFMGTSGTDVPSRVNSVNQASATARGIRAIRRF